MVYLLKNIENKLKKSILNEKFLFPKYDFLCIGEKNNNVFFEKKAIKDIKPFALVIFKKFLFNFIFFFSKILVNKAKKKQNFVLFLTFYDYLNTFFFNNKTLFYKKYFFTKNYNLFYLEKFFLNKRIIKFKYTLNRLKLKKIIFYKKNIWNNRGRRFRKKNILIFNKKFFKAYTSNRFNSFIVESIFPFFKVKKWRRKKWRIYFLPPLKKSLFTLFFKKYYYLFLHKKHIFSTPRISRKKKSIFLSDQLFYKPYSKCYLNKKFYAKRRRRIWRQAYHIRAKKKIYLRMLLCSFNFFFFDKYYSKRKKLKLKLLKKKFMALPKVKLLPKLKLKKRLNIKVWRFERKTYRKLIIGEYLKNYCAKLALRYWRDKRFTERFFSRRNADKRIKNIYYYFKWKKKFIFFNFFNFLKKYKNVSKSLINFLLFKFFSKKFVWKKRKNLKYFYFYYYNSFLFSKFFLFFNFLLEPKIFNFNFKRVKNFLKYEENCKIYFTRRRRKKRVLQLLVKKNFIRIFIIFLFLNYMKKHKNSERFFTLCNSFFLNKLKKINISLISYVLLKNDPYYKCNFFYSNFYKTDKSNLQIFSLLNKKKI